MCLTFGSFDKRARVAERLDIRASRGATRPSADELTVSQIALDWDFEKQCFEGLEFDSPERVVERYISDVCSECVDHLHKRPLDEGAKARSGLMVAGSLLCRRDFGRRISWSSFS